MTGLSPADFDVIRARNDAACRAIEGDYPPAIWDSLEDVELLLAEVARLRAERDEMGEASVQYGYESVLFGGDKVISWYDETNPRTMVADYERTAFHGPLRPVSGDGKAGGQ